MKLFTLYLFVGLLCAIIAVYVHPLLGDALFVLFLVIERYQATRRKTGQQRRRPQRKAQPRPRKPKRLPHLRF